MSRHWHVELAICWEDGTWTRESIKLDESDLAHIEGEPSEGEIWEAAYDRWESDHHGSAHVATGLLSWHREERGMEEGGEP
jgi:hypothetical protein